MTTPPTATDDHRQLDELTELVPGALLRYRVHADERAELLYISRYAMDIWGVTAAAAMADESLLRATGERQTQIELRESFMQAVRQRMIWWHEWRIKDTQGHPKWLRCTAKPLEQDDGSVLCTGMSGLELARELRALHPERPVAITSGFIAEELRRMAPSAGIADLIPKPNTCEELFDAIERLASRVCRPTAS